VSHKVTHEFTYLLDKIKKISMATRAHGD